MNDPSPVASTRTHAVARSRQRIVDRLRAAGCVFAEDEADLLIVEATDRDLDEGDLDRLVARRVAGEPLELVVGWASVAGRRVAVGPGVFVPRRRSELLVAEAIALLSRSDDHDPDDHDPDDHDPDDHDPDDHEPDDHEPDDLAADQGRTSTRVVVDLGCGTGALGLCIVSTIPAVVLHACDIDPVAVDIARRNLGRLGTVHAGDLFEALPPGLRGRVDLVVANLPYVPTAARDLLPSEARRHEPGHSLDGGTDGLDHVRRLLAEVPGWLRPGGAVLVELAADQTSEMIAVAAASGLDARTVSDESLGATVLAAVSPAG